MNVQKNPLEWTVFAVALAIVGGCVAVLLSMTFRTSDVPPDLRISVGAPVRTSSGFRVPVKVRNDGDTTAEGVRVEVTLESGGDEVEAAELTIAFVPRRSNRHGHVQFRRDPRCCTVVAHASGFETP
jgi:uncharacterized protein (TIGR02588 family)